MLEILKKKTLDVEDFKNYRPVSNLPFLSKVIEKTVVRELNSHMLANGLHPTNQSAYRQNHSTETALVRIVNDLLLAIDNKQCTFLVLLDQSAAFDTVNQDHMLNRLESSFGITKDALTWLTTYFKHRKQSVLIGNVSSASRELVTGFPQGSVLGPFMYPVYTSPLFSIAEKYGLDIQMYADDTQLYLSFCVEEKDIALDRMEKCISEIRDWMFKNHLKLNDSKTEFLVVGSKYLTKQMDSVSQIKIGDSSVDAVSDAKNIGAILDANLDLEKHVASICKSCYMHMHHIGRIRRYLTEEAAAVLVNALITSRLDYANSLLYGLPKHLIKRLELVQNNAARLVFRKKKRDNVKLLLKKLHWLPIRYRIMFKINVLTFKCIRGLAPKYLSELISLYEPPRCLRSSGKGLLDRKSARLMIGERAFSVAGPRLWNELPLHIRVAEKLCTFKSLLKTYYFRKAFA